MERRRTVTEVFVHGRHTRRWMAALGPRGSVWSTLSDTRTVRRPRGWRRAAGRRRVVIPLLETHIASAPRPCWALIPSRHALETLADKARFARYAREQGLDASIPETLDPATASRFPAVLKRTDLNAGDGVVVVGSAAELASRRAAEPWCGRPILLQALIEGSVEYVAHVVGVDGRIVWHCSYAYPLATARTIRRPAERVEILPSRLSASDLALFERFLRPLRFDGPASVDFKRRADGSIVVLEINPRLGGSLMRPELVADLADALRAILAHASWHEQTAGSSSSRSLRR